MDDPKEMTQMEHLPSAWDENVCLFVLSSTTNKMRVGTQTHFTTEVETSYHFSTLLSILISAWQK